MILEDENPLLEENQEDNAVISPEREVEAELDLECHEEAPVAQEDEEQQYFIERQSVLHEQVVEEMDNEDEEEEEVQQIEEAMKMSVHDEEEQE